MTAATIGDSHSGEGPGRHALVVSLLAWAVVIAAPLVAGAVGSGTPSALRLPVETILLLLLVLALPDGMPQRIVAYVFGAACVVAALIALLDLAFVATIDRGFAPTEDWRAVINAYTVIRDVAGPAVAALVAVIVVGLATGVVIVIARCALRCGRMLSHSRPRAHIAVTVAAVTWVALALAGAQYSTAVPLAAADVAKTLQSTAVQSAQSIRDRDTFAQALQEDPCCSRPAEQLLTGLRGTDVVVAFVESYGEVAVSGTGPMAGVNA